MSRKPLIASVKGGSPAAKLAALAGSLSDARPLYKVLAGELLAQTEANFAAQGRPSWVPLSARTKAERLKRNKGSSLLSILQDRGTLAASVSTAFGEDFALIGAGGAAADYAGIHQFGGVIERAAYSQVTRLKTDAKGNLVRQGSEGRAANLAVFARDRNKRVKEVRSTVAAFKVTIPARPYLPFSGPIESAELQPEAQQGLLDLIERFVLDRLA